MGQSEYVSVEDVVDGKVLINGISYSVLEITDDYIKAKAEDKRNDSFIREFCRPPYEREKARKERKK